MPAKKHGIVLVPYGTLSPRALATYVNIKAAYEREFPWSPVRLAFASKLMIKRLFEREIIILSPKEALAELREQGCKSAVIQSLQIVPGKEFHQLAVLARSLKDAGETSGFSFERLELGMPLLAGLEDCRKVSSILPSIWRRDPICGESEENLVDSGKEAMLLVGHGTGHPADSLYSLMAQVLKREHKGVFLGTLEGFPGLPELMDELRGCGIKRIRLLPFLLVAGGHAEKDILGDGSASWMSTLRRGGFEVETELRGMGDSPQIAAIFMEHTRNALVGARNGVAPQ